MFKKIFGSPEIKETIGHWIKKNASLLKDKVVADIPAGTGYSTKLLIEAGAKVLPLDLMPDFFQLKEVPCQFADLNEPLPLENESVDYILCQEGIEHISDQVKVFSEFSRVLKKRGTLILTTPNDSNLKSKVSYLLCESEYFIKTLPINPIDSVWYTQDKKRYFGHVFLIGFFKLEFLAQISGLKRIKTHSTSINKTSLWLFLFLYPLIIITNLMSYFNTNRKTNQAIWYRIFIQCINPKILLYKHLMLEFKKK